MSAILTVTLNPALDLSTYAPKVEPGPKLRCEAPQTDPGGGGVNVSRAIARLGGDSTALVALGGPTGATIGALLAEEGIRCERLEAPGDSRSSLAVIDRSTGKPFRFVLPGPVWGPADVGRALARIPGLVSPGGLVVLSGSLPPGVPENFPALLNAALAAEGTGGRLVVDTSGPAMRRIATDPAGIFLFRLNGEEAEELAGHPLDGTKGTAAYAKSMVENGVARIVVLARGAEGNILVSADGAWHAVAPRQKIISPVGAGDSFVGTLTMALGRGDAPPDALRLASAAASAALLTEATDLCRPEDVARIHAETVLTRL